MINYILAVVLGVIMGQVSAHLIHRLPEIIEDSDAYKKVFKTLKTGFKIDIKYSIICTILFSLIVYFVGNTYISYVYMILVSMLIVAFVIDFKMQLIPDTVQVVIFILGIFVTCMDYKMWLCHIIGMLTGLGIFLSIALFSKVVFKKEGMGMGDIKLMAGIGLIFGIDSMPKSFMEFLTSAETILMITVLAFFMAAIVAIILIITKKTEKSSYMAFGPYIVIATILIILFGAKPFVNVYFNFCTQLANIFTEIMLKLMN